MKHEQFVQAFHSASSVTQAYKKTYQCSQESADSNSYRLMDNEGIKNRLLEVMQEKGIDDDYIAGGLKGLIDNDPKGSVKLGALRTVLEVRRDISSATMIGVQVNTGDTSSHERRLRILEKYAARNSKK